MLPSKPERFGVSGGFENSNSQKTGVNEASSGQREKCGHSSIKV